jgi:hypothetical protein
MISSCVLAAAHPPVGISFARSGGSYTTAPTIASNHRKLFPETWIRPPVGHRAFQNSTCVRAFGISIRVELLLIPLFAPLVN